MVLMASERECFDLCGPLHLTSIDWENTNHRRSVAASLVQGVYILERDRQENRLGEQALAPPWWEFFNFRVLRTLVDDADSSIFGAVYEFKPPRPTSPGSLDGSPRFVVAFRGTLTKPGTLSRDVELDLHFLQHGLHRTSRFEAAIRAVRDTSAAVCGGDSDGVWLAGHSLGSAVALLSGKTMAKNSGSLLNAFLFNPPFFSPPIEQIQNKKIKHGIRFAGSVIAAGLTIAMRATNNNNNNNQRSLTQSSEEESFAALSGWFPRLFVNPGDHICSEYVGYFEHRKRMDEIGAGAIERLATQNSIGGLLLKAIGRESEPMHLIPSAVLTVNLSPSRDLKEAHGIHQWWRDDQQLQSNVYSYK